MRWRHLLAGIVLGVVAVAGVAAQYGGEAGYGEAHLQFTGRVRVSGGSCQQFAQDLIRCQVPAGTQGVVELTATVTPSSYTVTISAVSLPGWASFQPVSMYGTAQTTCTFTPPTGAVGQSFELRFRALTVHGLCVDLRVILDVVAVQPPAEPESPGPGYLTDDQGRFSVPVEYLPNTWVTGVLTQCTVRPLVGVPVEVTLIPKEGRLTIGGLSDVGAVRISTPYGESTVTDFRLLSSMDIYGRVTQTIDVGAVCIMPTGPVSPPTPPYTQPIEGTTDEEGKFSLPLPGQPGITVTGRLTECTVRPLPNQEFELTPIWTEGTISGFTIDVPGYEPVSISKFGRISIFGLTNYRLGDVCLHPRVEEEIGGEGEEAPPPSPPPRVILLSVGERLAELPRPGGTAAEICMPVYFQAQSVDELLRFRIEAPVGSVVEGLRACLKPLAVSHVYSIGDIHYIALPIEWLGKDPSELAKVEGWAWQLPVPVKGPFGTFQELRITRNDRVKETPINENTWFRIQEKELDKLEIKGGEVAIGYWEIEADIRTPDGRLHTRVRSVSGEKRTITFTYRDGRITTADASFPQLYQIFSQEVPVYELGSALKNTFNTAPRDPIAIWSGNVTAQHEVTKKKLHLLGEVDLTGLTGEWTANILGGAYAIIGDPSDLASSANPEIGSRPFYICPMIGDDDLPVETEIEVTIRPPAGIYEGAVKLEYKLGHAIARQALEELIGLFLTGGPPKALKEVPKWLLEQATEKASIEAVTKALEEKREPQLASLASVYQGILDDERLVQGKFKYLGGSESQKGALGSAFDVRLSSEGRPRYKLATGAAISVILLGPGDKIVDMYASAEMAITLEASEWTLQSTRCGKSKDYDPDPNSTWK